MREEPSSSSAASRRVAEFAALGHGLVSIDQLADAGVSRSMVTRWCTAGRLHREHRGVYAVGHRALTADGRRMAAVLALGEAALISHVDAAVLRGWFASGRRQVHVSVPAQHGGRSMPGIIVHRPRTLVAADRDVIRGIPVTSVARTLADLGDVVEPRRVRAAFIAAERARTLDMTAVDAVLNRSAGRRGARVLAEVVRAYDPRWAAVRSGLELTVLDLLGVHGVRPPEVDVWVADRYVADFLWRAERLIVEADSTTFHQTPGARRADARRDHHLRAHGYRVLRVSDVAIADDPGAAAARITRALRRPR